MKATYHDFLTENPKCGTDLENNITAKALFALLSRDRNIIAMINASDAGKPALSPVVLVVESYCARHPSPDFDLANKQRRTVVGCMIKTILSRFGYKPLRPASRTQRELSRAIGAKYFGSGSCYVHEPLAPATMMVVRKTSIEPAVFSLEREMPCPYCKSTNSADLRYEYAAFFNTKAEKMRELTINLSNTCAACSEGFKVCGHIIVSPSGEIEREKIETAPMDTPPK